MASELKVNTLKDAAGNNSVAMTYVANGSAKAWGNLNTQTNSIRDSLNASSMTDHATGTYSLNFANAFSTANYAFQGSSQIDAVGLSSTSNWINVSGNRDASNPSSASHKVVVGRVTTEAEFDTLYTYLTYHGDLA